MALSFLAASIRSVREWAEELEGWEDELDFVPLIAHLFALGTQLLLIEGSARLMVPLELPAPHTDLEQLREHLAAVSATVDGPKLYGTIVAALVTLEAVLLKEPSLAAALPPFTELKPLRSTGSPGEHRDLWGRVYHWIRPSSAFSALRASRIEEAQSHPPDPMPHPGIYLTRLSLYWDSDPQLPKLTLVPRKPRIAPFFRDSGQDVALRKKFRLALCPLEGPFSPRFCIKEGGRFFQAPSESSMDGAAALKAHLETVIQTARQEGVHLILFPELMVDANARSAIRDALEAGTKEPGALYGVVAGSFHFWEDRGPHSATASEGPPVNESVFLDRAGAQVMSHRKKGRYRVSSSRVTPKLFVDFSQEELRKEIYEGIRYGSELALIDTSLGRLGILICADAIAADDRGYLPLIRRLRPDLVLVVAMSDETEPFEAFAEEMSRYWIGTVFVNAHCLLKLSSEARATREARKVMVPGGQDDLAAPTLPREDRAPLLAAWNFALYQAEACPPTIGRWRFGHEPESFYFKKSRRESVGWQGRSADNGPHGITLLGESQALGLVLELGVHWRDWTQKRKEEKISC